MVLRSMGRMDTKSTIGWYFYFFSVEYYGAMWSRAVLVCYILLNSARECTSSCERIICMVNVRGTYGVYVHMHGVRGETDHGGGGGTATGISTARCKRISRDRVEA